jgi:hypothetical protein
MKTKEQHIIEARRYLKNACDILKNKAGNGVQGYYSDVKYVKVACNTAWNGVLVALEPKFPVHLKGKRKSVEDYKRYLATRNRKALNDFVAAYQYLHLLGGYDGNLYKRTILAGVELAESIIEWCEKN